MLQMTLGRVSVFFNIPVPFFFFLHWPNNCPVLLWRLRKSLLDALLLFWNSMTNCIIKPWRSWAFLKPHILQGMLSVHIVTLFRHKQKRSVSFLTPNMILKVGRQAECSERNLKHSDWSSKETVVDWQSQCSEQSAMEKDLIPGEANRGERHKAPCLSCMLIHSYLI